MEEWKEKTLIEGLNNYEFGIIHYKTENELIQLSKYPLSKKVALNCTHWALY